MIVGAEALFWPLEPHNVTRSHTIRLCKPRGKLQDVARRRNGSKNLRICRWRDVFPHIHHLSRIGNPYNIYAEEHIFHPKPISCIGFKGKQHSFVGGKARSPAKTLCPGFRSGNYRYVEFLTSEPNDAQTRFG